MDNLPGKTGPGAFPPRVLATQQWEQDDAVLARQENEVSLLVLSEC